MIIAAGAPSAAMHSAKLPQLLAEDRVDADHWRYALFVPADLAWFVGHFPGHPLLPGVAQIGWAVRFARQAFDLQADPPRIGRVKFQQPIYPASSVQLTLQQIRHDNWRQIDWRYEKDDGLCSRGRFEFHPAQC